MSPIEQFTYVRICLVSRKEKNKTWKLEKKGNEKWKSYLSLVSYHLIKRMRDFSSFFGLWPLVSGWFLAHRLYPTLKNWKIFIKRVDRLLFFDLVSLKKKIKMHITWWKYIKILIEQIKISSLPLVRSNRW